MKHLLLYLVGITGLVIGSCGLFSETSPVPFYSDRNPDVRLVRSNIPDNLQTERFFHRLAGAAAQTHGSLLPYERINAESDYWYGRLEPSLSAESGEVLRVTVPYSSEPLLVFVRNPAGDIAAVGGIPSISQSPGAFASSVADEATPTDAAAHTLRQVIIELALPQDTSLDGVGFVSPQAAEWDSESAPRLELGASVAELNMTHERFQLPAGLRLEGGNGELLIENLSALTGSPNHEGDSSRRYIELAYRNTVELPARNAVPSPKTIDASLFLQDGSIQTSTVRLRQGRVNLYFHPGNLGALPDTIRLTGLPGDFSLQRVAAAQLTASEVPLDPLPIDLGSLYTYEQSAWRNQDFELFQWSLFPHVLYFDFADYQTQARFFRRLAFFVEKQGYQGSLLSNEDLQDRHGYNAHNYNGSGLAAFFNAADKQDFELNAEEELLRSIAVEAGVIHGSRGDYREGSGGILSISRESPFGTGLRNLLMSHEAMHGVFYEQEEFSELVWNIWEQQLTPQQREFWRLFMRSIDYSPDDEYLVVNELQAYLLQYPHRNNDWYFNSLIRQRMLNRYPQRSDFIDRFYRENPDFFVDLSREMNRILYRTTGLVGGDVRDIVSDHIE